MIFSTRRPCQLTFDRGPWQDFAILLDNLSLVVDQDKSVVRILFGVLFMLLSREGEDAPGASLLAL